MTSTSEQVREFHETYAAPIRTDHPTVDFPRVHLRMDLIAEEFAELVDAVYGAVAGDVVRDAWQAAKDEDDNTRDVVEAADALADIDYVINGFALEANIPHDRVVAEVHQSNMSKLGSNGLPILRDDGKVLKGPNYFKPDIITIIYGELNNEDQTV